MTDQLQVWTLDPKNQQFDNWVTQVKQIQGQVTSLANEVALITAGVFTAITLLAGMINMGPAPLSTAAINIDGSAYGSRGVSYKGTGGTNGYFGGSGNFEVGTTNNSVVQFVTNTVTRWSVGTSAAASELIAVQGTARVVMGATNGVAFRDNTNTADRFTFSNDGTSYTQASAVSTYALTLDRAFSTGDYTSGVATLSRSGGTMPFQGIFANSITEPAGIGYRNATDNSFFTAAEIAGVTGAGVKGSLLLMKAGGDVSVGPTAAHATNATTGFLFIGQGAGVPSGVPATASAGLAALFYDSTDHRLYIYDQPAGAWKGALFAL